MKKGLLTLLLLSSLFFSLQAQINSYPFTQSLDTYQLINGTAVDVPYEDDVFHANLPIGFNFNFNGNVVTKFGICTNGYIVMDSLTHNGFNYILSPNSTNVVGPLIADLRNTNNGGTIEYTTLGTAPNRVLVVQWKDYGIFSVNYCHLNFQIRLLEGTNCINFYYGQNGLSGNNYNFSVGVVASATDYVLRTTTNDWTLTSPSTNYANSYCHLGPISNLPNGLVFGFGTCPPSGIAFSYLHGKVYNDANNNGAQDAGENGLANVIVHESLQNIYATTNNSGDYDMVFLDSTHTYSLTATTPTYWNITNIPATHTVTPLTQSTSALDFGMYATPNIHDVAVTSWSSNLPWPNASVHFYVTYHNNGTVVESDTLYFNADSLLHFVSASPAPSFTNGNTFAWVYSNLQLQEYRNIQLHFQADTSITQLDTLHSNILIQPLVSDALQSNNTQQIVQRCLSSFDPNDKAVAPSGAVLNTQLLEYTIRFQNTGTAPAANVFVVDDIDPNADLSTFQFLGASHSVTYSITGTGHIVFTFANINLPDSNSNEPLSHGLLRYSIYPRAGLAVGSTILNTAAIRFDFNSPVITNTTTTTIKSADVGGIISASNKSLETLVVFPNPAMDEIKVQNLGASLTLLTIYDVNGSIVLQEKLKEQAVQFLNISQLVPGVYLVSATSKSGTIQQVKLVKAAR